MKRLAIEAGGVYGDGKGTKRQVLNFQAETGRSFGDAGYQGGSPAGDNLRYEILEGRGKGQINVMTARSFARWAKSREN